MAKKVTQSDIAKMLNISRITVSKVLNAEPGVSDAMRERVIQAAIDTGYKKLSKIPKFSEEKSVQKEGMDIVLITHDRSIGNSFWSYIVQGLTEIINKSPFHFVIDIISNDDEKEYMLGKKCISGNAAGLIFVGIFSERFLQKVQNEEVPKVFVDYQSFSDVKALKGDIVMMENEMSVFELTSYVISKGHKRIGFIGDIALCRSFMERWYGYERAMNNAGLTVDKSCCIIQKCRITVMMS